MISFFSGNGPDAIDFVGQHAEATKASAVMNVHCVARMAGCRGIACAGSVRAMGQYEVRALHGVVPAWNRTKATGDVRQMERYPCE